MKILITGNLGYVAPSVIQLLRNKYPEATLIGFDIGYFAKYLTHPIIAPERWLDIQYYGDVREFPDHILEGIDAVVHLAAISNDPIGNSFEEVTLDINYKATIAIAEKAKKAGVKSFVFASSCSVYGFAEEGAKKEDSTLNPLTAYAKSKILSEEGLYALASENFHVTCLRFATACGMSHRLRLDLVLNDFVASAIALQEVNILSDGTPWRPLINTKDMARAIDWAINRHETLPEGFIVVNAGSNKWNYQVKQLAETVKTIFPHISININPQGQPDKRSYKVSFDKFATLAPQHQCEQTLESSILELKSGMEAIGFQDKNFRTGTLIRLNIIRELTTQNIINNRLAYIKSF